MQPAPLSLFLNTTLLFVAWQPKLLHTRYSTSPRSQTNHKCHASQTYITNVKQTRRLQSWLRSQHSESEFKLLSNFESVSHAYVQCTYNAHTMHIHTCTHVYTYYISPIYPPYNSCNLWRDNFSGFGSTFGGKICLPHSVNNAPPLPTKKYRGKYLLLTIPIKLC